MGKAWKKDGMLLKSQKKGAQFSKLAREIQVAARLGGVDPEANSRLRLAIRQALNASCPKATIERALQKAEGASSEENFEEILYEGQGPHQVGILVACQTDNKNRSVTEVRTLFKKLGGQMVNPKGISWMFDKVSLIIGKKENVDDCEEEALEAGAWEVEFDEEEKLYSFYGDFEALDNIREALLKRGWDIEMAEMFYKPKNTVSLEGEKLEEVEKLLEALRENEDTFRIYSNLD